MLEKILCVLVILFISVCCGYLENALCEIGQGPMVG